MSVCKCILALVFLWTSDGVVAEQKQQQFSFPTETKSITVPFEWHRGHLLLKVEVNGKELGLTLDNGVLWDALLLYGGPRVDSLGLELDEKDFRSLEVMEKQDKEKLRHSQRKKSLPYTKRSAEIGT